VSTDALERGLGLVRQYPEFVLLPHLAGLLAQGKPVPVEELAAAAGWSVKDVEMVLRRHPSVERDANGRLVGLGITLRPTPHAFIFEGGKVYGWCASDALTFPVLLNRPGTIESICAATGAKIRIEATPQALGRVEPPGTVVSAVRPQERVGDIRAAICSSGHFFSSRTAAEPWLAQHPDGIVLSIEEEFAVDRRMLAALGWAGGDTHAS
jgi:alkylmercury lyase